MIKIALNGCNGRMGDVIVRCAEKRVDCKIIAGIDKNRTGSETFPVFDSISKLDLKADVIIDFSNPSCTQELLEYCVYTKTPVVLATTGLCDSHIARVHSSAEVIPVFFTANMSLGINLMSSLAAKAARVLGEDFDIEIVEAHHNNKIDAPSGTALLLAQAISDQFDTPRTFSCDRHLKRSKRDKKEIGIHSVRAGTIVGEHEIIFAGHNEVIKLSHIAMSKEIFAMGAINAALFICGKDAGLFSMSDLIHAY